MSYNTPFSPLEKKYITDNAGKKSVDEIAANLNRSSSGVVAYMVKNNLEELTAEQHNYVMENYKTQYLSEVARHLGINYFRLYGYCQRRGLIMKKNRISIPPVHEEKQKPAFERPPAVYSNPSYHNQNMSNATS